MQVILYFLFFYPSLVAELNAVGLKRFIQGVLVLEEFLKELASLCLEQSVHAQFATSPHGS